jgi:hypothetical protein
MQWPRGRSTLQLAFVPPEVRSRSQNCASFSCDVAGYASAVLECGAVEARMEERHEAPMLEAPYRPRVLGMLLAVAFFGGCAAVGIHAARTNDSGLIINGVLELSERGATIFWYGLAAASLAFVAAGCAGVWAGLFGSERLIVTESELIVPKTLSFGRPPDRVALREIRELSRQEVQRQRFLIVTHSAGRLTIGRNLLPDDATFERIEQLLVERAQRR